MNKDERFLFRFTGFALAAAVVINALLFIGACLIVKAIFF
jgi:hypothetical protein